MENLNESRFRWQYSFLEDHVSRGSVSRILDLGCGDGELMLFLAKLFPMARVTGVDTYGGYTQSEERKSRALQLISEAGIAARCRIIQADILERPFPANSFDLLHARNVLHHLFDCTDREAGSRITSFFEYLLTLLSRNGYIVVSEIGPVNYVKYLKYVVPRKLMFISQAHNMEYHSKFPLRAWSKYLRAAGFDCRHVEHYVPYRLRRMKMVLNNEFAGRFSHSAYSVLAVRRAGETSNR